MPGLIPGASEGKGLGLQFLRHVERCHVLVHVIDCATLEPGRDPLTDLEVIEHELAEYVPHGQLGGIPLAERVRELAAHDVARGDGEAGPSLTIEGDPGALRKKVEGFIEAIDRMLAAPGASGEDAPSESTA